MIYKGDLGLLFNQLTALREEFPGIIYNVCRNDRCDYASLLVIEMGFVSIGYGKRPCRGFFVSVDKDPYFAGKYYNTAAEAFDDLSVWMHKNGYRFKRFDTGARICNACPVSR